MIVLDLKRGEQLFIIKVRVFEGGKFKIKTLIVPSRNKINAIGQISNSKELGKYKVILSVKVYSDK